MRQEGRLNKFLSEQKISRFWFWGIFCFAVLALIAAGYLLGFWICRLHSNCPTSSPTQNFSPAAPTQMLFSRHLDGVSVTDEAQTNGYPIAVMIDNMIDARPQSGISHARLVIEAPAEAQITRFLAVFDSTQNLSQIGPVRSARPYFADWASEFHALYVHSGGSPEVLENLKNGVYSVTDLNEFYNGQYFTRSKNRYAPHNLFTSNEQLLRSLNIKNLTSTPDFPLWQFQNLSAQTTTASSTELLANSTSLPPTLKIAYNQSEHLVVWKYNSSINSYLRYQGGKPHLDTDQTLVTASNIVIQWAQIEILDNVGRRQITTTGTGKAWIFQNGQKIIGTWRKDAGDRTRFFGPDGLEIKFVRGTTWIEVVGDSIAVE